MKIAYVCPAEGSSWWALAAPPRAVLEELRLRGNNVRLVAIERPEDRDAVLGSADAVLVHRGTASDTVEAIGRARAHGGEFVLLLHDPGGSDGAPPEPAPTLDLEGYDGVLVSGEALAEAYRGRGWGRRSIVWREAVDVRLYRPAAGFGDRTGIVSLADWGDATRGEDLVRMLLRPAREAGLPLRLIGHGYPAEVAQKLGEAGVALSPRPTEGDLVVAFGEALLAVELADRGNGERLPGLVTRSMLQALACGLPLVVGNWHDAEGLFTLGEDLLLAHDAEEMAMQISLLREDATLRATLAAQGRLNVLAHHSASHRADELVDVIAELCAPPVVAAVE